MDLDEVTRQLLAKHGQQIRQREEELRRIGHTQEHVRKRAVLEFLGDAFRNVGSPGTELEFAL